MAKGKNEILLSIALEGDAETKAKLKAVGEEGKRSFADIEKKLGDAQKRFGNSSGSAIERAIGSAAGPLGKVSESLAPLLEGAGLSQLAGGGLLGRLFGAAGPAAAIAALGGIALRLAKVSEEADATDRRLKSLGGSNKAFDRLNESAKRLGASPDDLNPAFEHFLSKRRSNDVNADGRIYAPGYQPSDQERDNLPKIYAGGHLKSGPGVGEQTFLTAQRTLDLAASVDQKDAAKRHAAVESFLNSITDNDGIISDAVKDLKAVSPNAADFVAKQVGKATNQGLPNSDYLTKALSDNLKVPGDVSFKGIADGEETAKKAADAARGVSDALNGVGAGARRLEKTFSEAAGGPINKVLTKDFDKIGGAIDAVSNSIASNKDLIEKGAKAGAVLGSAAPIPIPGTGALTGAAGGLAGAALGIGGDLVRSARDAIGQTKAGDFLGKALTDPGALQEKQRPGPPPPGFDRTSDGLLIKQGLPSAGGANDFQYVPPPSPDEQLRLERDRARPPLEPPSSPAQQPSNGPVKFGDADQPQQVASIGEALQQGFQSFLASVTKQQELKQQGPVDGGGIRGEGGKQGLTGVAEVDSSLKELAAVFAEAAGRIKNNAGPPVPVQAAAGGGWIRRFIGGGGVSGPGTATSDSIPAMLSDGEYVIRESAARKIGRARLDRLNAGGVFAGGGSVDYEKFARRFAGGGLVAVNQGNKVFKTANGYVRVFYDGDGHVVREEPLSRNPLTGISAYSETVGEAVVGINNQAARAADARNQAEYNARQQRIASTRHKSDFVGRFGSSSFFEDSEDHYAKGGPVGRFIDASGFVDGGLVGDGGGLSAAPAMSDGGTPWGDLTHIGTADFRTDQGEVRVTGKIDALKQISGGARDKANFQTGPSPSWDR